MDLKSKLPDAKQTVLLYGTTPPRQGTVEAQVEAAADRLAERLQALPLDAVVVYDIQDETGRTAAPRPFPYMQTVDPRGYARLLAQRRQVYTIVYKCVGMLDEAGWRAWLAESARRHGVEYLSIVGRPAASAAYPLALSRAIRIAAASDLGFVVGGVAIAERHDAERSEAARLLAKGIEGCAYFISQAVYHAPPTQRLLADYLRDCRGAGTPPQRFVLTFAPVGREKTMTFLRWLGVNVPDATAQAILGADRPLARSIEICRDNLRRILDAPYARQVPLGINVESVSINRDEIDASIELFHVLKETLEGR